MKPAEMTSAPDVASGPREQKNHSLGARIASALAFGFVGAKPSWLAVPFDVKRALDSVETPREQRSATLWGKMVNIAAKTKEIKNRISQDVERNPELTTWLKKSTAKLTEYAKVFRYSVSLGIVGAAAGAVLGWVRGNRAGSAKEIVEHPLKSVKLVLGIDSAASEKAKEPVTANAQPEPSGDASAWQKRMGQTPPDIATVTR